MSNTIPNVESRLIQKTIQYGADNSIAKISTLTIAELAGVSEYTIFKHFKTKRGLLDSAAALCDNKITAWCLNAVLKSNNIEDFWNFTIEELKLNTSIVLYYYKYNIYFGPQDFPGKKESCIKCARQLLSPEKTDEECLRFWDYFMTLIYLCFSKVNEGFLSFESNEMDTIKDLIFNGIKNF